MATTKTSFAGNNDFFNDCRKLLAKGVETTSQLNRTFNKNVTQKHHVEIQEKGVTPIKLVIFDKDGTLICFHSTWGPWSMAIAHQLKHRTGLEVTKDVYNFFNYDPKTGRIGKGSLAEKTHDHLQATMCDILKDEHLINETLAKEIVTDVWNETDTSPAVTPVCDVKAVFSSLKTANIKIAICTSDDRKSTVAALEAMEVEDMVDYVLCGNDPHNVPKPAPDNVYLICSQLGVDPQYAAVIGDTPADTRMGRTSGAGLVIGVLSGVCDNTDLGRDSDLVLENIEKALPFIMSTKQVTVLSAESL